ncbi:glycosyltransferase, group 2 family protein [Ostertagia ostertagi]
MCAYNVAPYLEETIHSILNQTYRNIEFIMVDDCSTDDTLAIMQQYAALDNRIKVLRNAENMGMSRSRNVCLAHSSGKYIAIQDADDISLPHRLETQVNYLEQPGHEQVGYCGAWLEHFGTETAISKYPDLYLKEMQLSNCMFGHPSTMFRMALIDKYKLFFDEKHGPANDYGIQTALVPYTDFHNVQEVLVRYRQHATNARTCRERTINHSCKMEEVIRISASVVKLKDKAAEQIAKVTQSNQKMLLRGPDSEQGIFDPTATEALKKQLKSNNPEDSHATIWALIVFQYWWKKYLA